MRHVEQRRQVGIIAIGQQQAVSRHQVDQPFKRGLDRSEIFKNIRVVVLHVIENGDLGQIMNKLAALVEKGRVVLVAFNNKPFAVSEARTLTEIVGDAANEIAGIEPVVLEDPCEQ